MVSAKYRIDIVKDGKALCEIEIGQLNSSDSLTAVLECFPETKGLDRYVFISKGETRYLEHGDKGNRLLASVSEFEAMESL